MKLYCPYCHIHLGYAYGCKLHRKVKANGVKLECRYCHKVCGHTFMDERSRFGNLYYMFVRVGSDIKRIIGI